MPKEPKDTATHMWPHLRPEETQPTPAQRALGFKEKAGAKSGLLSNAERLHCSPLGGQAQQRRK